MLQSGSCATPLSTIICAAILFYETDKPYGCFSNFSRHPIVIDGIAWPTSEHYFQAAKFTERADVDAVRSAPTPFLAAQMGRERQRSFRNDWDSARDTVMREALHAKFTQHTDLLAILLSTHGAALVEHTRNDRYWADGGDGSGLNMLGKLLGELRTSLLTAPSAPARATWREPPWVVRPDVEPSDLFWRMGEGEGLLMAAARCASALRRLFPRAVAVDRRLVAPQARAIHLRCNSAIPNQPVPRSGREPGSTMTYGDHVLLLRGGWCNRHARRNTDEQIACQVLIPNGIRHFQPAVRRRARKCKEIRRRGSGVFKTVLS